MIIIAPGRQNNLVIGSLLQPFSLVINHAGFVILLKEKHFNTRSGQTISIAFLSTRMYCFYVNKNIELFFQMKRSKSRDSLFIRIKRSWSLDIVGARRETYTLNTEEREGSSRVLTNTTQETSY